MISLSTGVPIAKGTPSLFAIDKLSIIDTYAQAGWATPPDELTVEVIFF